MVFYYLIPDSEEQESTVRKLEHAAHCGQAESLLCLKRYDECLQQIHMARSISRDTNDCLELQI